MPQLSRIGLTALTFVVLCLGHAAVTRADTIAFTGSVQNFNNPPAAPNVGRCGAFPPNLLVSLNPGPGTSNLGAFTATGSFCVAINSEVQSNGLFSFDFANGNTFFGTISGTSLHECATAPNFFTSARAAPVYSTARRHSFGPGTVRYNGRFNGMNTLIGT